MGINRVRLYKEYKANAKLVQRGECWTWNQRLIRGPGSILTGGNITGFFCFHVVKPLMLILVLLPILYVREKVDCVTLRMGCCGKGI